MRAAWLAVDAASGEDVLDVLLPGLDHGVHERRRGEDVVELVVCAPPDEDALRAAAGRALRGLRFGTLPDEAAARRRALHEPRVVAGRFHLRPAWADVVPGLVDVALEDGPAFGTGAHPTTRMVLALLAELADERSGEPAAAPGTLGSFLDLGCGSGVLSVAAARLGFGPVVAVDADPAAVAGARAAAARNAVAVDVRDADLCGGPSPTADVVAANVRLDVLEAIGRGWVRPPAVALVSGIAPEEATAATAAFGLREVRRLEAGGWAALRLERPT